MSTTIVPVSLSNGAEIHVEATRSQAGGPVAFNPTQALSFSGVRAALEGISNEVMDAMRAVKPKSAKVEFGIKVSIEPGKVTALLVQGSGEANLTVTLEWD